MSAPRRPPPPRTDVREYLIDAMRARCDRYRDRVEVDGALFVSPWPRILAALEAGREVEVPALMLPRWARGPIAPASRVRVAADGTVHPVVRS